MLQDFVKKEFTPAELEANRKKEMEDAYLEEAGLEDRDIQKLRKTMMSAEEAIAARTEQLDDARIRKSRKPDWDEYIDAKRRFGKALHHSELIAKLRKLVPGLFVCDGMQKNTLGLYIWDRTHPFQDKTGGTVFLGWCHRGYNPEYEIDIPNDVGVAVSQLRGWRTLLIRMLCRRDSITFQPKSLFTEQQLLDEFGPPTNGETASKYREHLYNFRNTSPSRAKLQHQILQKMRQYS